MAAAMMAIGDLSDSSIVKAPGDPELTRVNYARDAAALSPFPDGIHCALT
jgi:hypothetical protein